MAGVTNIYDETAVRAYRLARTVDRAQAEAVFLRLAGVRRPIPGYGRLLMLVWGLASGSGYLAVRQLVFQQLSDPAFHPALVKAAQQVDPIAVRIAAVPVFIDLLPQPER